MSDVTKPSHRLRRWAYIVGGIVVVLALAAWLAQYLLVGQYEVSTDDAYLAANFSIIAPKVSGYVTYVAVRENQQVQAGALLVRIDPRDEKATLAAAVADVQSARAASDVARAQLALQQTKIAAAQAALEGDRARLAFAAQNQARYHRLLASGASPAQTADQADTALATARASVAGDEASLLAARLQVRVLRADIEQAGASLAQAAAQRRQAALDLGHTTIRAPFSGVVGDKSVAVGDYLQPGTQIMAIVPLARVYVLANYKETQLTHLRVGQPGRIIVDAYPGLKVTGRVDSIAPASGQEFALLPPDNATGNFIKIVQRVPVKIDIHLTPALIGRLRPGMSVEPSIDIRHHR